MNCDDNDNDELRKRKKFYLHVPTIKFWRDRGAKLSQ